MTPVVWSQIGSIALLAGVCLKLCHNLNGQLKGKVDKEACHAHIDSVKQQIRDMDGDVKEVKADIKIVQSDIKTLLSK